MERAPGDPRELLRIWMEWEEGETTPGKVMSDLKLKGMRELLDGLVAQLDDQLESPSLEDSRLEDGDDADPRPAS